MTSTETAATVDNGAALEQLATALAEAEATLEAALAEVGNTKGKDVAAIMASARAAEDATKARDRAKAAYDKANWELTNGARMEASKTLAEFLKANVLQFAEVASAKELGVTGFQVRFGEDGSPLVDVFGAKAPGSPRTRSTNGGGTTKPRQFVRNRHTGEEVRTRDWTEQYGDEKAANAARLAATGTTTKDGTKIPVGFQPHLKRMLKEPKLAADWVLVRKYADHEEVVEASEL